LFFFRVDADPDALIWSPDTSGPGSHQNSPEKQPEMASPEMTSPVFPAKKRKMPERSTRYQRFFKLFFSSSLMLRLE
jgi:hypothetical protein